MKAPRFVIAAIVAACAIVAARAPPSDESETTAIPIALAPTLMPPDDTPTRTAAPRPLPTARILPTAAQSPVPPSPTGTLIAGGLDGRLTALSLDSGALLWTSEPYGGATLADDSADAESGGLNWKTELGRGAASAPLVVVGKVLVGAWDGRLYALNEPQNAALAATAHEAGHALQGILNPAQNKGASAPSAGLIRAMREAQAYAFDVALIRKIGDYGEVEYPDLVLNSLVLVTSP